MQNRKEIDRKLKGYRFEPKGFALGALDAGVSPQAYWFFSVLVSLCDWDTKHFTYGVVKTRVPALAERCGCNISTVYRYRNELEKVGLVRFKEGRFSITEPERFHDRVSAKMQVNFAELKEKFAKLQETGSKKLEETRSKEYKEHIRGSIPTGNEDISEDEIPF